MDTNVTPAQILFTAKLDGVDRGCSVVGWKDAYTLTMQVQPFLAHPDRVLLTYDGPSEDLRTTWQKQWEPWDRILCNDVPLDWEHVLDVDVDNARVTINDVLQLSTQTLTAGVHNNVDATLCNVLYLNASAGLLVLGGFTGGVEGQNIDVLRVEASANDVVLNHNVGAATQKIFCHAMAPEILNGEYGGWSLQCNGTHWYDVSHAKHV